MGAILYAVARAVPDVLAHMRDRRERRRYVRTGIREIEVYLTRAPARRRRQP